MAYPSSQHFGAPPPHSPQPGFGYPQGGPPGGAHFQQPPYPPQQHGYPPQGQYPPSNGFPPQGQFPPQNGFHQGPPPPGPYGQPGFGQQAPPHAYGPPALPSPGYDVNAPLPPGNASQDANALFLAMKGFGTDEKALSRVLSKPDPNQMRLLVHTYNTTPKKSHNNLEQSVTKETSGYLQDGLLALIRGPLHQDVYLLHKGMKGIGTKESFLNDVLCGRSNADLRAIKALYQQTYRKDLLAAVKDDLSLKTETLFTMILAANRAEDSAPYDPMAVERDVMELQRAMSGVTTDQLTVCQILTSRSNAQIRGIDHIYQQKFHTPLTKTIQSKFSGHMEDALVLTVNRATDSAMSMADQLEQTMKGIGTKDELLVQRVVRAHWDRAALDQVKKAYRHRYGRDLISRVKGEVRGHVEEMLVACLE